MKILHWSRDIIDRISLVRLWLGTNRMPVVLKAQKSNMYLPCNNQNMQPSKIIKVQVERHTLQLQPTDSRKVGILNFALAMKPGEGFLNGAQAQEESISRASTLYPTVVSHIARDPHDAPTKAFYTHSIIYSPDVEVVRDDNGDGPSLWVLMCSHVQLSMQEQCVGHKIIFWLGNQWKNGSCQSLKKRMAAFYTSLRR